MSGSRFIKTEPTQYVIQYRNGRPAREGAGLAFCGSAPSTSITAFAVGRRAPRLRRAGAALHARRTDAVEQERTIKENELATEIAVENKKRQVREAQMEAERSVQTRRLQMQQEEMTGKIGLEE